ncbi:hypothetical protein BRARA_B02210 [Brassica rapa]|uniref:Knottins-like domain-containing protein n=5 Tax=Brassica TaxID=3705 RepID=A0A398ABB7_BRACM|nr:defensin-like protein 3 [Brassica rapa]XP_013673780.1 defensin-like protein 3 [Brassica napus]XP_013708564.1 defensin-like protein 3 [Brassica napus]KAF3536188.1 hypothetical protein F2Q69_00020822 [Brassica cretica]KAG5410136.1 hypothetical protein IGI04_006455 [Brassica rapa subsp. trilocularis]VDD23228.1 unnamed protein product [Brassica oleracea]RID75152.1 hypothetical protein BRARA_B02210 [Brassica rapa]CAF1912431.1 unnamed protein product [Brassica napus]
MAKFASIITLLFAALVFFAAFEAPMMVEGQQPKYCRKQSKTWSGLCTKSGSCKKQCIRVEKAAHGSCNYIFPIHKCICYYLC